MESGERELKKAFEEVTTRNVMANIEYSKQTRKLFRELEDKTKQLEGNIKKQNEMFENMKKQLTSIQTLLFKGGTE